MIDRPILSRNRHGAVVSCLWHSLEYDTLHYTEELEWPHQSEQKANGTKQAFETFLDVVQKWKVKNDLRQYTFVNNCENDASHFSCEFSCVVRIKCATIYLATHISAGTMIVFNLWQCEWLQNRVSVPNETQNDETKCKQSEKRFNIIRIFIFSSSLLLWTLRVVQLFSDEQTQQCNRWIYISSSRSLFRHL